MGIAASTVPASAFIRARFSVVVAGEIVVGGIWEGEVVFVRVGRGFLSEGFEEFGRTGVRIVGVEPQVVELIRLFMSAKIKVLEIDIRTLRSPFSSSSETHVLVAAINRASSRFSSYSFRVRSRNCSAVSFSLANLASSSSFERLWGAYGFWREVEGSDRF